MFQNCLVNTPKYSKLCTYRYSELTFSYSFFSVWTHKLRFLGSSSPFQSELKIVFKRVLCLFTASQHALKVLNRMLRVKLKIVNSMLNMQFITII